MFRRPVSLNIVSRGLTMVWTLNKERYESAVFRTSAEFSCHCFGTVLPTGDFLCGVSFERKATSCHTSWSNSFTNSRISVAYIFNTIKFQRISFFFYLSLSTFAELWIAQCDFILKHALSYNWYIAPLSLSVAW